MTWIIYGLGLIAVIAFIMLAFFLFALLRAVTDIGPKRREIEMQAPECGERHPDIQECEEFSLIRGVVTRVRQKVR